MKVTASIDIKASPQRVWSIVSDMEAAIRRWSETGAEVVIEPTDDPIQRVTCCLLRTDGSVDIELVAPITPGDSPVDNRLKRGGGLDHPGADS